ncbi:MAG: hypothetical protein ACI4D4_01465 [Lachnospira sp.]
MFSKKMIITVCTVFSIFLIVCIIGIVRINIEYPNAKIESSSDSIEYGGCTIKPISKQIYEPDEYNQSNPDDFTYQYLSTSDKDISEYRIVQFTVSVTNHSDKSINLARLIGAAEAYAKPSYWSNGAVPHFVHSTVEAGSTEYIYYTSLYTPVLVREDRLKNMSNNKFSLVFSFYPIKYEIVFR